MSQLGNNSVAPPQPAGDRARQEGDPTHLGDLVVVLNPAAGSGRAASVWERLLAARPALAQATLVADAAPGRAAENLVQAIADPATKRCIAIGGDGTLHGVVNQLFAQHDTRRVAVGLVPAGTGSDFARTLGLPRDPLSALDQTLAATAQPIDLIRVTVGFAKGSETTGVLALQRVVMNIASAGLSGVVDTKVNALKRRGTFAFLGATLAALREYRPTAMRVTVDGTELYSGPAFLVAIANGRYFGKGMKVAPHARVDDGLAEVVVVGDIAHWQLPFCLPRIYLGTHLRHPQVYATQGRLIRLEPLAPLPPFDVDGETLPSGSATFELLAGAVDFLA